MNKIFPFIAVSCLLLSACNKEDVFNSKENNEELQYVTVGIDVDAGSLVPMTGNDSPSTKSVCVETAGLSEDIVCEAVLAEASSENGTKAINDPATTSDTAIKNLWVIQFDGVGDEAVITGTPVYIENYDDPNNRSAKLVASTTDNTIVFLANTFDKYMPFPNDNLKTFKDRRFTTQSLGTILAKDPNTTDVGGGSFPNDGDYYQRLNGFVEQTITEGSTLSCALGHNACRISVNVTNNTVGTAYPVTLESADIENVPGCMYYFTDYDGYTSGSNAGKPTMKDISLYGQYIYSDVIIWTAAEGTSTATKSAKFYLSANESGVVASNTNPKLKSLFSPNRATVLKIKGTYSDGTDDIPIRYTFALGEDLVSNYQLVPNGDYVYNITLNARGDKTSDPRVYYASSTDGVDYTETSVWPLSNCYICNPPSSATGNSTYRIPVARVDQFWGGGDYENVPNNCLGIANAWTVSVIWSDMEVKPENFAIIKATGTGKDDYFEVSVPGTSEMGNVVIGIKNNLSEDWLWSWHLWVTDYCPDEAKYLNQQGAFLPGTDTYHVTGGDVQRYQAAAAGTVQKVYMDRSIGAMSTDYVGSRKGMLYYQYGRKDPFPGTATTYWEGGTVEMSGGFIITSGVNKRNIIKDEETDTPLQNVPYSVKHPTTFISSSNYYWTYDDQYNPVNFTNIIWQDPFFSNNGGKSIFDPSPSGWKVSTTGSGLSNGSSIGFFNVYSSSCIANGQTVRYPKAGYYSSSGIQTDVGSGVRSRFSALADIYQSHVIFNNWSDYSSSAGIGSRVLGMPIRSIQE